jgi:hypothetical protein
VNPELENSLAHAKGNHVLNGTYDNQLEKQSSEQKGLTEQQLGSTSISISINNMSEKNLNVPSTKTIDVDSQLYKNSYHSEALEVSENSEVIDLNAEKVTGNKVVGESNQDHSTSILDKFFGSALTSSGGGPSSFIEVIMISKEIFVMPLLGLLQLQICHFFFRFFTFNIIFISIVTSTLLSAFFMHT